MKSERVQKKKDGRRKKHRSRITIGPRGRRSFFFGKACGEGSTYILYITTYLEMGAIGGSLAYWDIICYCRLFINLVHSCITAHRKEQETIA